MGGSVTDQVEFTAPAYWASYLINGDDSGLEPGEKERADQYLKKEGIRSVLDVALTCYECGNASETAIANCTEDGTHNLEGCEPSFTWSYEMYGGNAEGGEVLDYIGLPLEEA
jgi:hypothetical protein